MAVLDCYGAEPGRVSANLGPDVVVGTPSAVSRPTGFGHGSYCLRINPAASTSMYVEWTRLTPATLVMGFALNIDSFGTSTGQSLVQVKALGTGGASKFINFGLDGGTKKLFFQNAAGTKLVDTTARAVTDVLWVDLKFDFSGATWTYSWAVNDVALAAITSDSQVASAVNYIAVGNIGGNTSPYSAYMDDFVFASAAADYPLGSTGRVVRIDPRAGAGSIDTTNSVNLSHFHDETATVAGSASGGSITSGPFGSVSRYIAWDTSPATGDRVYAHLYDTSETITAKLIRAYAQFRNADGSASANTYRVSAASGGTITDLFNGSVASGTSIYRSAVVSAPSGGWTVTNVNNLQAMFGAGSSNNNAGHPALEDFVAEAVYVGTSGGGGTSVVGYRTPVVTKQADGTATSINVVLPTGVGDGEQLAVTLGCADQTATDLPAPSGWTRRSFAVSATGGGQLIAWFTKAAVTADAGATVNFAITGGSSGSRQSVAVATSAYDSVNGAAVQFDEATTPTEDTVGPALAAPQMPAPSSGPCLILTALSQDQSAGTEPVIGSVTTDSGGSVTKIADAVESTSSQGVAVAAEAQTTPAAATHTFNYTGGGTAARGGVLGSIAFVLATSTTSPPPTPTGLAATSISDVQVTLGWNANTDGATAAYNIYRDGALAGTTSGTSFQDTAVAPATGYSYQVSALDSSGNESTLSTAVPVTTTAAAAGIQTGIIGGGVFRKASTSDTIPPSVPAGVTASAQSSSSIKITWAASTDDQAVANYILRRGGTTVATVAAGTLSFTDTGLAASTIYSYTVEAVDAAGNTSGQSSPVTAQTLAAAGSTSWSSATAYAQTPPAFTPSRTVVCGTFTEFQSAWNNAQPGDLIDCTGATFTYTGEFIAQSKIGTATNPIRVVFGANCLFNYTGGQALPAVWFKNNAYVQWFDGRYSTNKTGAQGLRVEQNHDCYIWLREWNGSKVYDCGHDGLFITATTSLPYTYRGAAVNAGNYRCDFYIGEITNCGLMWATRDPHGDGSGFHGIQFADGNYGNYDCRVAAYIHDHGYGAGIQAGGSAATDAVKGCTFLVKALNLTNNNNVAYGNGSVLQWWGTGVRDNTVAYIEGTNIAGRIENNENSISLTSCVTQYGRAFNACYKMPAGTNPFDTRGGMVYQDIASG